MSAHGYIEHEVPMDMHAFDPLKPEIARVLIKRFGELENAPFTINVNQDSFYLDKTILEVLLTETRNYAQFDCLNLLFGLDNDRRVVLLVTKSKGSRTETGIEKYVPVPMIYCDRVSEEYVIIEYALLITNDNEGKCFLSRININGIGSEYDTFLDSFRTTFQPYHPLIFVKAHTRLNFVPLGEPKNSQPSGGHVYLPFNTLHAGYRLGKGALREIWKNEGGGSGIKFFLGYGDGTIFSKSPDNLHIIAVGTDNPDFLIDAEYANQVWSTVDGSGNVLNIDGSSTCVGAVSTGFINT